MIIVYILGLNRDSGNENGNGYVGLGFWEGIWETPWVLSKYCILA